MSMSMMMKSVSLVATALACLATPAQARRALERLAIAEFHGPQAGRIQGAVESGLMARYYLVPDFTVEQAAREQGVRLSADSDFGLVGRTLDVSGFVSARVQKRGAWQVRLEVRRGDTGAAVGSFVLADRRLERLETQVVRLAPARVRRLLAQAATPEPELRVRPAPAPAPPEVVASASVEPQPLEVAAQAPPAEPAAPGPRPTSPPFAELSIEGRLFTRSFSYVQNLSGLPDYKLVGALATAVDLTLYPAPLVGRGFPPIGVTAALDYAPGVRSRVAGSDQKLGTSVHAYRVGVKYRLAWSGLSLAPQLAYGAQVFQTADPSPGAPDVRYRLVWAGADARWEPGARIAVLANVAYLYPLSTGSLGAAGRFPRVTANGATVEVGAAVGITRGLEVRLTLGLRRFGLAMHARPGDTLVAGGAVDELSWVGLGLAYRPELSR
jgi:hypothetical protein